MTVQTTAIIVVGAFLAGVVAGFLMACYPTTQRSLPDRVPKDIAQVFRGLKTEPGLGHYVLLPALSSKLENEIASGMSLEKINVYRSPVVHALRAFTLWSFDIGVRRETVFELFDLVLSQMEPE